MQLEEVRNWCQYRVIPWRYVKETAGAYWSPDEGKFLRWMIAVPDPGNAGLGEFGNYIFGVGAKRFLPDYEKLYIDPGAVPLEARAHNMRLPTLTTKNGQYPAYFLGNRTQQVPWNFVSDAYNVHAIDPLGSECPAPEVISPAKSSAYWKLRYDFETLSLPVFNHVPKRLLRVDYFEGVHLGNLAKPDGNDFVLRETWHLAEGIGVFRITQKDFGKRNAEDMRPTLPCQVDLDCRAQQVQKPRTESELVALYQPATPLSISVAGSDKAFKSLACAPGGNYTLRIDTPGYENFTGYLEVITADGGVRRWKNLIRRGQVTVSAPKMVGDTTARFRMWIPNEAFNPNNDGNVAAREYDVTPTPDSMRPWSNPITVSHQTACP